LATESLDIEKLPRRNATQVKSSWGDVSRAVQSAGSVAITNHDKIEMVILSAAKYCDLIEKAAQSQAQAQLVLERLTARFDAQLASLQAHDTAHKIEQVVAAKGVFKVPPKAGQSF
jgi:hypothetical protein